MTGEQLLGIREHLGLSQGDFLLALGLLGKNADRIQRLNAKSRLRRWETGVIVPPAVAAKAAELWLKRGGCGS